MKGHKLQITDVSIGPEPFPDDDDLRGRYHEVRVTVRNASKDTTLYVNEEVRHRRYDVATKTLSLGFHEEEYDGGSRITSRGFHEPPQTAIEPGSEVVLVVPVVKRFVNIDTHARRGENVEDLDTTGVEHVVCRVAYDEAPFRPSGAARSGLEKHQEFAKWGRRVEGRCRVGRPGDSESGGGHAIAR